MPRNHYAILRKTAHEVAEKWPKSRAATRKETEEEHMRYDNATSAFIADVQRNNPLIGREMIEDPMPFGIRLMFRTCHIASLVVRQDGASVEELVDLLRAPGSFDPIETLLRQGKQVTYFAEVALGLAPTYGPVHVDYQDRWSVKDNALSVPTINQITQDARHQLTERGLRPSGGICPAHRSKIVEPLFRDIVTICGRDENLFERSLTEK
jgi:hypothetical protein